MKANLVRNVKSETYIGSSNRFVLSTIKVSTIQCTIQYPESNQKRRPQTKIQIQLIQKLKRYCDSQTRFVDNTNQKDLQFLNSANVNIAFIHLLSPHDYFVYAKPQRQNESIFTCFSHCRSPHFKNTMSRYQHRKEQSRGWERMCRSLGVCL